MGPSLVPRARVGPSSRWHARAPHPRRHAAPPPPRAAGPSAGAHAPPPPPPPPPAARSGPDEPVAWQGAVLPADEYAWMRRQGPGEAEVLQYLSDENRWAAAHTVHAAKDDLEVTGIA